MRIIFTITITLLLFTGYAKQSTLINSVKKDRTTKWIEDINYFEKEFLNTAKTYTEDSRDSCKVILNSLKERVDELSDTQIILGLSKCVVLADNGHTTLPIGSKKKIPLRFYRFSEGIHVVRSDSAHQKYLGAKVLKINNIDINEIERQLFPYISGIERAKLNRTIDLITSPKILKEAGIIDTEEFLAVTLLHNNKIEEVSLSATLHKDRAWWKNWANLYPVNDNEAYFFLKSNKQQLPLYLREADQGVFYSFFDKEKIAYFHINSFWEDCPNFKERIDNFNEELKTKRDYDVVIDLRFYTGGDYTYANKLATKPPKIINQDKNIYLITSNKTYSAAIVTAARVKYYAKNRIVIVGEEVGDRLKFWAESKACELPNSGINAYNPRKEHDWKDNKRGIFRTHITNFLYGVPAKELKVNKEIQISFKDYLKNRDSILEWIIEQK